MAPGSAAGQRLGPTVRWIAAVWRYRQRHLDELGCRFNRRASERRGLIFPRVLSGAVPDRAPPKRSPWVAACAREGRVT